MKKFLLIILVLSIIVFYVCREKNVDNIIPEGEYDFVESYSSSDIKTNRDTYEESDYYVDNVKINVWKNNKATFSKLAKREKYTNKFYMLVTDDYLINEEDRDDKIKYNYTNDKIELYYEDGSKEVYIKDYQKKLEEKYEKMIGHYEITSWIVQDKEITITDEIKKETYLDVSNNKKIEINIYGANSINCIINSTHFYIYHNNKKYDYTYEDDIITLFYNDNEKIIFEKIK